MLTYPVQLTPDETGYHVTFPDFPGIFSAGDSRVHALEQAADALQAAIEFSIRDRLPIPAPSQPLAGQDTLSLSAPVAAKVLQARTCLK